MLAFVVVVVAAAVAVVSFVAADVVVVNDASADVDFGVFYSFVGDLDSYTLVDYLGSVLAYFHVQLVHYSASLVGYNMADKNLP